MGMSQKDTSFGNSHNPQLFILQQSGQAQQEGRGLSNCLDPNMRGCYVYLVINYNICSSLMVYYFILIQKYLRYFFIHYTFIYLLLSTIFNIFLMGVKFSMISRMQTTSIMCIHVQIKSRNYSL